MISLRSVTSTLLAVAVSTAFLAGCSDVTTPHTRQSQPAPRLDKAKSGASTADATPASGAGVPGSGSAIFAKGNLTLTGNGGADSYLGSYNPKHPNANGSVAAGGNITLTGSASVLGDATAQGTVTYAHQTVITGTVSQHATLAMPTASICPAGGYTPAAVVGSVKHVTYDQSTGALTVTGNATLTLSGATQYYFSKVTLTGNSTLQVVPSGAQPTAIFIDDAATFTGGSVANATDNASNLTIWGCGPSTTKWTLTGNSDAYFCVVAPAHDIDITGNDDLYGGVVGNNVKVTGNGTVHRDETASCGSGNPLAGPDIKADLLQVDVGNGPHAIGAEPILAGEAVTLDQWVDLVSGPAAGPVTCTLTISNGTTSASVSGSVVLSGGSAACQVPYTFPAAGSYTVQTQVSVGGSLPDPDLANNVATNTLAVTAATNPAAHVVVSSLAYTDANVGVTRATPFAPNATGPDTVHASDAVTYTATIAASNFLGGATTVPSVVCSATDNGNPITVTWITGPTISGVTGAASCSFTYATGETDNTQAYPHTIGVSIATPGFTNTATTGTSLSGVITVPAAVPQATVAVTQVAYSDAAENIGNRVLTPNGVNAADSVHSGDAATYTATINVADLRNATQVPTITCLVKVDNGSFSPVHAFTGAAAGTESCVWTNTFTDPQNNNQPTPHTITFAATTGTFKNNAAPTDTAMAGVINDYQRVDVQAGNFIANPTTGKLLSDTTVKQTSTITLNLPVTNLNATVATNVVCGQLTTAIDPITYDAASGTYVRSANDTVPSALTPTQVAPTTFALNPGQTANCQYAVTAPTNLGLISVPLAAIVTSSTGAPLDPVLTNNIATGNLTIVSNGEFTDVPDPITAASAITAVQQWHETPTLFATTGGTGLVNGAIPDGSAMITQAYSVTELALLVIPTRTTLGTFALSGTLSTGNNESVSIGSGGMAPQALNAATGTSKVCLNATALPLNGTTESQLSYSGSVCTKPTTVNGQNGYQQITVSFYESLSDTVVTSSAPPPTIVYNDTVTMKIRLDFTLTGSTTPDAVTATVKMPINALSNDCVKSTQGKDVPYTCESSFSPFIVKTP